MTAELKYTLASALIIVLVAVAYGVRLAVKGRVHFDRIDRQGGTLLLTKGSMELGYWMLQPVARLCVFLRISPNMVSWISLVIGFLAGAFLAVGHFGFAAMCATISGLLDSVDGMVARISGVASDAGEVLDAAVDRYVEFFFLAGLVIYYREIPVLQVLSLLALLGSFMVSYSTTKAEALDVPPGKGSMRRPERVVYLTLGATLSAISVPWLEAYGDAPAPLAVGYPMVLALALVAVIANISAIERFRSIAKATRYREKAPAKRDTVAKNILAEEGQEDTQTGHRTAGVQF
jgi:CDP-diacylglycerol---glycerol-3-phosphate 3-phosphatidyltransferase